MIRRRQLLPASLASLLFGREERRAVSLPVLCLRDAIARTSPAVARRFRKEVWNEAVRVFATAGVELQVEECAGEMRQYPSSRPRFIGLERGRLNLVLTDRLPMEWDHGRGSAGGSLVYEGFVICVIALPLAHGYRTPMLATNTVVHELLHVLLGDVFTKQGSRWQRYRREVAVDWLATQLWLGADSTVLRAAAQALAERMRSPRAQLP